MLSLKTADNNPDVGLRSFKGVSGQVFPAVGKTPYLFSSRRTGMKAYVLDHDNKPLMPTSPRRARLLLKQNKASVVERKPLVIKLNYKSAGNTQPVVLGVDSGYVHIGLSAVTEKKEVYAATVSLRKDIVGLNSERRMYRRTRRYNKTWYRQPRFLNRGKPEGWFAPSIEHKADSHVRIVRKVMTFLPVTRVVIEVAAFDIQKIQNPDIAGAGYQEGVQKDFWNVREYVLYRDGHTCQHCNGKSKDPVLEVHHIESRQTGGDRPGNLLTLCTTCHTKVSAGKVILNTTPSVGFKAETFMSVVRWQIINRLRALGVDVLHTYGYMTKSARIVLKLPKSHVNDAFVVAGGGNQQRTSVYSVSQNRRNNRALQINRKGYKPSIRRNRYPLQPHSLVRYQQKTFLVKGMFSYGKWVRLTNSEGVVRNVATTTVDLIRYQRGFAYANLDHETLSNKDRHGIHPTR